MKKQSISQRIEGTTRERMVREFFLSSGLFQIFHLTRITVNEGIEHLVNDPGNYLLLISAFLQTWIIERWGRKSGWRNALFLLIAPITYTVTDIANEGWYMFRYSSYHWIYWSFSILLVLFTLWRSIKPSLVLVHIILMSILRTSLFPVLYFVAEMYEEESIQDLTIQSFITYWSMPGHTYILAGSVIFGFLIGVSDAASNRSFATLQHLAKRLHELTGWSFDQAFTESAVDDAAPIRGQRVSKIILFMDIRGFTNWSETHKFQEIIEMLNSYYETAEQHIIKTGGAKPHFTGDEVMTWFTPDDRLFERIQTLQTTIIDQLQKHNLTVGVGIHFGEVVEGLMGSSTTKKICITGDPVNTCARICSAALPGELLLSEAVCRVLALPTEDHMVREIIAKGKIHPLKVFSFSKELHY